MKCDRTITLTGALNTLRQHGITGNDVYLVDFFPLIEMVWADGQAQQGEIDILNNHIKKHVEHVNKLAGCKVLHHEDAEKFIMRFIETKPDPEIMTTLRKLVTPIRLSTSNKEANEKLKKSLLSLCMDIAAIATTMYPYKSDERFDSNEKECFYNIMESFSSSDTLQASPFV